MCKLIVSCVAKILCFPCYGTKYFGKTLLQNRIYRNSLILYISTIFIILPYILQNVKYSMFYKASSETEEQLNLQIMNDARTEEAERYIKTVNKSLVKKIESSDDEIYDVAIAVVTMSRNRIMTNPIYKPKYLTQVIGKFLKMLSVYTNKTDSYNIGIFICNVDSDVSSYHEAIYLSSLVPMVTRFNKRHFSMVHTLEKEKEDYVFCLNKSFHHYPARYHFLVEDDALPRNNMFEVLHHVIKRHLDFNYIRGRFSTAHDILFVKFYHPERLLDYSSLEIQRLLELLSLSLILTFMVMSVIYILYPTEKKSLILWLIFSVYFICVLKEMGRVNVNQFRELLSPHLYSLALAPSCCTPAILYPNKTVNTVIQYLSVSHCKNGYGKDSILDQLVLEQNIPAYLVEPNTFQHIGAVSALRYSIVNSQFV